MHLPRCVISGSKQRTYKISLRTKNSLCKSKETLEALSQCLEKSSCVFGSSRSKVKLFDLVYAKSVFIGAI